MSVVNWNTRDELAGCLDSILGQEGVSREIIVVDNGSRDGSAEMIERDYPQVQLIANAENCGFARALNRALKAARGRYIFALNPDARIIGPDAMVKLVEFLDSEPKVGIAGIRVLNSDGSLQFSARRFPTLGAGIFRNTFLGRLFPKNRYVKQYLMTDWGHDEVRDVDWVSGAAMAIRREVMDGVGLLDERFFMYCEDVDICYRARQGDWRVVYFPRAAVKHRIGASSDLAQARMLYQFHKSMWLLFGKHFARDWPLYVRPLVMAGLAARGLYFITINAVQRVIYGRGSRA